MILKVVASAYSLMIQNDPWALLMLLVWERDALRKKWRSWELDEEAWPYGASAWYLIGTLFMGLSAVVMWDPWLTSMLGQARFGGQLQRRTWGIYELAVELKGGCWTPVGGWL